MVYAVTGQATHIFPVMLATRPLEMRSIASVAREARFIGLGRRRIGRRIGGLAHLGPTTCFGVLLAIAVTNLTRRRTRTLQEPGALSMSVESEHLYYLAMTLQTVSPNSVVLILGNG
jgi:hypothetical protein